MMSREQHEKEMMILHLRYISCIAFIIVCAVTIFPFCNDTIFKSYVSVSSTVVSIILSTIAIILSVTGERTINEIRNKLADSVNQLEKYTIESSHIIEKMKETSEQLQMLRTDVNSKMDQMMMNIKMGDFTNSNEYIDNKKSDNPVNHVVKFLNAINPTTKKYVKEAYTYFCTEVQRRPIEMGDVLQHLIDNGCDVNTGNLVIGLVLGNLSTGTLSNEKINELINQL